MIDQENNESNANETNPAPVSARRRDVAVKLSPGGVISGSFAIYLNYFLKFTAIGLLVYSPLAILRMTAEGETLALLAVLLGFLMPQVLMAAIISGVFRHLKGEKAGIGDCISTALSRLLPVLGTFLLMGFVILLISIIPLILVAVIASATSESLRVPLTYLAMIPGAWVYCALYAAIPAVVAEKSGIGNSFRRSQILTRGNRMRIFLILLALNIFAILLQMVAGAVLSYDNADALGRLNSVEGFIMFFIQLIPGVLLAVAAALVFFNLKVIVEGADEKELASVFD